jgi:transcription initiation factor IIE alpha subunit
MKAKMKKGLKPPESGEYQCQKCNQRFNFTGTNADDLVCPKCGESSLENLIPIYMENNPEEEQLYSEDDWHGGD